MCKISIEHYKVSCYICYINVNISKKRNKGETGKMQIKAFRESNLKSLGNLKLLILSKEDKKSFEYSQLY